MLKDAAKVIANWERNQIPDIDMWESEGGACARSKPEREVRIPDNPPQRSYACPGCNKGVVATRMGNSSSYTISHVQGNDCKYHGPILK